MFEKGRGVPRDYAAAAAWYRKAAEPGYGGAQNNLAIAFALGHGVPKDPIEAYKWFALAATHGDTNGADIRAGLQKSMTAEQIAEAEKRVHGFVPTN
jgi:localization factor PodJL